MFSLGVTALCFFVAAGFSSGFVCVSIMFFGPLGRELIVMWGWD
jgi:hypothetical protein